MISNVLPFLLFILSFFLISLFDVFNIKITKIQRDALICFSLLLLILFAGCRWTALETDADSIFDYATYKYIYLNSPNIFHFFTELKNADSAFVYIETGYTFYCSLMYSILGDSYNLFLLVTNLIAVLIFYKALKSNKIVQSCIFFIFFFYASRLYLQYNFILVRQTIAMVIVWYAFSCLINKEKIKFVCLVLLASTFHLTALLAFVCFFFLKQRVNEKVILGVIASLFLLNLFRITDSVVLNLLNYFFSSNIKYQAYLTNFWLSRPMHILNFVEVIPFLYIVRVCKDDLVKSPIGLFYYNMFYFFLFFIVVTMNFGFLTRMTQYFMFSYIFLLSFYFERISYKIRVQHYLILGCYLIVYPVRYSFHWFYDFPYSDFLLK